MNDRLTQDVPHGTIRGHRNGCETSAMCDNFGTDRLTCIQVYGLNKTDPQYRQYLELPGADGARGDWPAHRRELIAAASQTPPPAEQLPSTAVISDVVADDHPVDVVESQPEEGHHVSRAEIRAWCYDNGVEVNPRGPIARSTILAYTTAMRAKNAQASPEPTEPSEEQDLAHADPNPVVDSAALKEAIHQELHAADPPVDVDADPMLEAAIRVMNESQESLARLRDKYRSLQKDYDKLAADYRQLLDAPAHPDAPLSLLTETPATYLSLQTVLDATATKIRVPITLGIGRLELALDITQQGDDTTRDLTATVKGIPT